MAETAFVLIAILYGASGGPVDIEMQEFLNERTCEVAADQLGQDRKIEALCVEK